MTILITVTALGSDEYIPSLFAESILDYIGTLDEENIKDETIVELKFDSPIVAER